MPLPLPPGAEGRIFNTNTNQYLKTDQLVLERFMSVWLLER